MPEFVSVIVFFVLGLLFLIKGGDILIDGAKAIALRTGLSPMVVGLTVVGFGTSAPELLVSLQAALNGQPALAVGNVMGSNVANVLLILAVGAIVAKTILMPFRASQRDFGFFLGSAAMVWVLMLDGQLGRFDGLLLVAGLGTFLWASLRAGKQDKLSDDELAKLPKTIFSVGMVIAGLFALVFGADWFVYSASATARGLGISEAVIGLTVVAVGTSLPELFATYSSAKKGEIDMAVGNVVGSNIFNIFSILGIVAVISPIPIDARFVSIDAPLAFAVAALVIAVSGVFGKMTARMGWVFIGLYVAYTATMFVA